MGTNFYLHEDTCPHCGRDGERLHIGKSSAGWCFSLHVDPEIGITTLGDWAARWSKPQAVIKDEYGVTIAPDLMMEIITERTWHRKGEQTPLGYPDWETFHRMNNSVTGPNGLLRHQLGHFCVGHGEGTYDLIPGEFS
jgi:hypothetical protein